MATYNRPGVYVNELPLAAAPVNGALAATAAGAVIAAFPQGSDQVTLVTSWYDFVKKFGGYSKAYPATFSVGSFFKNGGAELYVKRILPAIAKKVSKVAIPSAAIANTVTVANLAHATTTTTITTTIAHGITTAMVAGGVQVTVSGLVNGTGANDTADSDFNGTYTVTSVPTTTSLTFTMTHATVASHSTTTASASAAIAYSYSAAGYVTFAAKHRGQDGNNIRVKLATSSSIREPGYYDLTVYYEAGVADTVGGSNIVSANAGDDIVVEQFNGVVFNDPTSGDYIVSVLEFGSAYIRVLEGAVVEYDDSGAQVSPEAVYTVDGAGNGTPTIDTIFALSGAPDVTSVALTYGDYTGNFYNSVAHTGYDPVTPSGTFNVDDCSVLVEFESIDKPLVFFLPDVISKIATASTGGTMGGWNTALFVYNALISWVEAPRTGGRHFVVAETEAGLTADLAISAANALAPASSRAAVYYPHVYIKDPVGRSGASVRRMGPSGSIAGLYLGTDRKVGPFKTPAGIETKIVDAIALERAFSPSELDALNTGITTTGIVKQNVINAVRNVPGAGIVVMGGRTLLQDGTANRYVSMRRSLTYLEKRLNDIASFAVFDNNTEKLWARLITVIGAFLNEYRNQGGLRGTTIDESYYVKCDSENNTANSIAAGEVHIEVGVALEYPAEFVIINLSQKTAE